MVLFYCYLLVLLISSVVGLVRIKNQPVHLKYFAFFLLVTLFVELAGLVLRKTSPQYNHWLYNLYLPIHYFFYSWLYYRLLRSPFMRRLIAWSAVVFVTVYLGNIWKGQGINVFNSYSYLLSSFLLVGWVMAYFLQLILTYFQVMREPLNLARDPTFYISAGVLIFNLSFFFYLGLLPYLLQMYPELSSIFQQILMLVNILLYSLFAIAFLCSSYQQPITE